ncbi:hypothetical protein [Flavobacterium sp.]|uniref:hypothetical protein n=1 Tax=Flavobacterium sp. TaxID=239 RepID=UPI0039E670EC
MRTILILMCSLLLLVGCKSKKTAAKPAPKKIEVVEKEKINEVQKDKAYDAGKRILMTCNTSKFKPFSASEATPTVIKNTTQERLTKTCLKFRLKYGDFRDIQLVEVIHNKTDKTNIYRYKALYEKKIANKELRVTMNEENKVSAIKSLDWVDKF